MNMWLLDRRLNVANHLLPQRQPHQVTDHEPVQVAKAPWKWLQASQREGSSQRRSHCLKIPQFQETLNILKQDDQRVHVSSKAWPHHPDLDENHLGLFPTLTTSQHTLRLLSPLLDQILADR